MQHMASGGARTTPNSSFAQGDKVSCDSMHACSDAKIHSERIRSKTSLLYMQLRTTSPLFRHCAVTTTIGRVHRNTRTPATTVSLCADLGKCAWHLLRLLVQQFVLAAWDLRSLNVLPAKLGSQDFGL